MRMKPFFFATPFFIFVFTHEDADADVSKAFGLAMEALLRSNCGAGWGWKIMTQFDLEFVVCFAKPWIQFGPGCANAGGPNNLQIQVRFGASREQLRQSVL